MTEVAQIKWILVFVIVVVLAVIGTRALEAQETRTDREIHCMDYPTASDCP